MTDTEKIFLSYLKPFTDKYNFIILPQVQLQSIFKITNNKDIANFNKIKSKSVDFAIVDNKYNYKVFIELDDYTHNQKNRIERDIFVNNLFNTYNLKLKRIKVQNNYNLEQIESIIKEVVN
jgi:topoisomerase DNA-binding C4 zinc finger domain protein